jgi:hypothetical protein
VKHYLILARGLCLTLATVLLAAPVVAQTAPDPQQQKRLVEQKLKLVETLANSPAANAAATSSDTEVAGLIERGRGLLKEAREAIAAARFDEAGKTLDEALRSVSRANSRSSGNLAESAQKQKLQEMSEQVTSYRASMVEMTKNPKIASEAQAALQRVDALADEGRKLAAGGRMGDANKKMADAYKLAIEEISRLRSGDVVTMSLKFDSPAEEYAYEQKRFQSNEILVGMMVSQGRADGGKQNMVDGFVQEAKKLKDEAASLATAKNHKEAVAMMEKAYLQLNRALQTMGVPAF